MKAFLRLSDSSYLPSVSSDHEILSDSLKF